MPEKARVLITVIEDELISPFNNKSQQQLEAVKMFITDSSGKDELSADNYAELESGVYRPTQKLPIN